MLEVLETSSSYTIDILVEIFFFLVSIQQAKFPYNQEFMHWKERLPVSKWDIDNQWFVFIALILFLAIMIIKVSCVQTEL